MRSCPGPAHATRTRIARIGSSFVAFSLVFHGFKALPSQLKDEPCCPTMCQTSKICVCHLGRLPFVASRLSLGTFSSVSGTGDDVHHNM
jgi:hypothetical protein